MSVGALETNCYLVVEPASHEALLIDPGADPIRIFEWCALHEAAVRMILNTHGHGDHIGANGSLKDRFRAPLGIHRADAKCLTDPVENLSAYFDPVTSPPADFFLEPDTDLEWAGPPIRMLHTPGHSPGSVSFYCPGGWVVSGDTLFKGGIGRTDFPGSDRQTLIDSIRNRILTLPQGTIVYPGHGPATTVGEEIRTNPFLLLG
jgi:glyoxylase-like metal-dependent hydrolase (beta-lactamase superfamily II)